VTDQLIVSAGVVAGNPYDKYGTSHPIERRLVDGFLRSLDTLLDLAGPVESVLEVGCGEGRITARLARRYGAEQVLGTDLSPEVIEIAQREYPGLRFEPRSLFDLAASGERWDLIVACEVFEHLEEPARALRTLARAAGRAILITVPREPIWRILNMARGKYWSRLGNSHGHVQHWSRSSLLRFLRTEVRVVSTRSPLPWTQVLCAPKLP
jgi:2-polyprenyl-3-methyl-5-hydroxy-6-metoxy-1,4-benzoquinol methylase